MVLGIDIDDTIVKTTIKANELLHGDERYANLEDYHYLEKEEFSKFIDENISEIMILEELFDDVVMYLTKLQSLGVKIIFITARTIREEAIALTNMYMLKNKVPYDEIVYKQKSKAKCCMSKNVDIYIDDKEHLLDEVKNLGIDTILFKNGAKSVNHKVMESWQDIYKYVLERMNTNG